MNSFQQFKLLPFIVDALTEKRITKPTDIQARIIPAAMNGRDIIGKSQTGTGKTLAFLLPMLQTVDPSLQEVQAIVVAPTRELAWQIHEELKSLLIKKPDYLKVSLVTGGTDRERQMDKMKTPPQIIIGTPGRILDLMKAQALFPHRVRQFVVDEADQMLDMGFLPEVDRIAQALPEKLQTMVFSATIPDKLETFMKKYLHDPRYAEASTEHRVAPKIKHHIIPVRHRERNALTVEIAQSLNPYVCLVFTNTKQEADELEGAFRSAGLNVGTLHGDMPARRRKQAIKDINDARFQFVIATDLAARGIDISGVSHVINHGLPKDLDFYTHRVGRTGRAGATGEAYTLYAEHENGPINRLEERGFTFTHVDVKNGRIQEIKTRRRRITDRKLKVSHTAHSRMAGEIKKAKKKVKPGYKKKFKYKLKETASREFSQKQRSDRRAVRKENKKR